MAESEGHNRDTEHPAARLASEAASARRVEARREGVTSRTSDSLNVGATENARSLRKGGEQKALADGLNRTSESEKKVYKNSQLEQMDRRNRELNLSTDRRVMRQRTSEEIGLMGKGTEQNSLTDRLNRATESEKKAHLNRQLGERERHSRELNLSTDRRNMIQSEDLEHSGESRREKLEKTRLMANEIASRGEFEIGNKQPDAMTEKAYESFSEGVLSGTLEKGEGKKIKAKGKDLIIPRDAPWKPESPGFWNHHGNTKEIYDKFALQYPEIQNHLMDGTKFEDIRKNPKYKEAVSFWYSGQEIVANDYKNCRFVESGYHRAELAREYKLEGVPVTAHEWKDREIK